MEVLRAEAEWQRVGAYSVRIEGMNRQHHISLRDEFDEHDCDGTKYIVLLDDGYPVATCRFYDDGEGAVTLGRVVVLPEYRHQGIGTMVVSESRVEVTGFYEKLGYSHVDDHVKKCGSFGCVRMNKIL